MNIAVQSTERGHALVTLSGRLDLTSAETFRAAVNSTVADGTTTIVIDLQRVFFIDSSGLGALLGAYRRATDAGGELRIAAPAEAVTDMLSLMRVDRLLPPYDTVDAALTGL